MNTLKMGPAGHAVPGPERSSVVLLIARHSIRVQRWSLHATLENWS
jgi:hypothetical protein